MWAMINWKGKHSWLKSPSEAGVGAMADRLDHVNAGAHLGAGPGAAGHQ
jgi:hypothetical protein